MTKKKPQNFDILVIGGGSAGYAAANTASQYTRSIGIVDNSPALGGLCILRGCMPSKTLIYAAEILHLAQKGNTFGLQIPKAKVDMKALQTRKKALIEDFAHYRRTQLTQKKFKLFREKGTFINPETFQLESSRIQLTAKKFVIATGSYVNTPSIPGLKEISFLTSDEILDLNFIPKSTIVLGGGVVACELAQFLKRIGSKVIQIQRSPHILKEASTQTAKIIENTFKEEGIELFTHTHIQSIKKTQRALYEVTFKQAGKYISKKAHLVFNALGRKPASNNLGLEKASVKLSPSGHILTNNYQQTSNKNIYAAGDVCGPHEIVHVAVLQGEYAAHHALGKQKNHSPINYDHLVKVIFTDPQFAHAGLTEKALKSKKIAYIKADYPFNDHGKSLLMDATKGYVKIWAAKKTGIVLGAECLGKDASELIHPLATAITLNATVSDLLKVHWYHPTLSEIWTYPLELIQQKL